MLLDQAIPFIWVYGNMGKPQSSRHQVGGLLDWFAGDTDDQIQPIPGAALSANEGSATALVIEPEAVFAATGRARPVLLA
ncbi:hypothetical protein D3C78_1883050 [compost metagenome]